jgi:hypothetical protein
MILKASRQFVKEPSGGIHIRRRFRIVQSKELNPKLVRVLRLNSRFRSGAEEFLDSTMPEALNHYVECIDTVYDGSRAECALTRGASANTDPFPFSLSLSLCPCGGCCLRVLIQFFLCFPQNIEILHSFVTTPVDFFLEPPFAIGHIAHTQARSSLKRLLVHRKDARSFPAVPEGELLEGFQKRGDACWLARALRPPQSFCLQRRDWTSGTDDDCGSGDSRWRAGTRALRSAVNAEGAPHAAPAAVAGRGHFALHTARVAGPGRIYLVVSRQSSVPSSSSIVCHPERSEGPAFSLRVNAGPAKILDSLFICPILLGVKGGARPEQVLGQMKIVFALFSK